MTEQNIRVTLDVSVEQLDTINQLFGHYGWNFVEVQRSEKRHSETVSVGDSSRRDASSQTYSDIETGANEEENILIFHIPQNQEEEECRYCLCKPCITDERNQQLWWETVPVAPNSRNSGLRKDKYQRFWTMMYHRNAWQDPRYTAAKIAALRSDPHQRQYEWHRRDIMPKCILTLVREWFPNPPGVPYMGHLWE